MIEIVLVLGCSLKAKLNLFSFMQNDIILQKISSKLNAVNAISSTSVSDDGFDVQNDSKGDIKEGTCGG